MVHRPAGEVMRAGVAARAAPLCGGSARQCAVVVRTREGARGSESTSNRQKVVLNVRGRKGRCRGNKAATAKGSRRAAVTVCGGGGGRWWG